MLEPKPRLCHALPLARVLPAHTAALCPFCLQTRPTPPHLTSAMAENILAAACESETRKAAKRMRLEIYQSSQVRDHAGCSKVSHPRGSGHCSFHMYPQLGYPVRWEGSHHIV